MKTFMTFITMKTHHYLYWMGRTTWTYNNGIYEYTSWDSKDSMLFINQNLS